MGSHPKRFILVLIVVGLFALVAGLWIQLASDWVSEPVERLEASGLENDPVFSKQTQTPADVDAGSGEISRDNPPSGEAPPAHGFCPADGRMRVVNLRKTLRFLLDSGFSLDQQSGYAGAFDRARAEVYREVLAGRYRQAQRIARRLAGDHSGEPSSQVLRAYAAVLARERVEAKEALKKARRLDPDHPYLALAFGVAHADDAGLDEAIRALDVFLAHQKDRKGNVAAHQLRARLDLRRELQKDHVELDQKGVSLLANPELDRDEARDLLEQVVESLQLAAEVTGTRRRPELTVVVYRDRSELLATTCSANWAGGIFDGTLRLHSGKQRSRSAWKTIVRHEAVHAQLRSVPMQVPTWFNEGLAQLVAGQFGKKHIQSFERMIDNRTYIPFGHMFQTFVDFDTWDHARIAYHQSLAMLAMMIEEAGESAIGKGVSYLAEGGDPKKLLERVAGRPLVGKDLLLFLEKWRKNGWLYPEGLPGR